MIVRNNQRKYIYLAKLFGIKRIKYEITGENNNDECYRCGRLGHLVNRCQANYDIDGQLLKLD